MSVRKKKRLIINAFALRIFRGGAVGRRLKVSWKLILHSAQSLKFSRGRSVCNFVAANYVSKFLFSEL
jgi:hypothetical protein